MIWIWKHLTDGCVYYKYAAVRVTWVVWIIVMVLSAVWTHSAGTHSLHWWPSDVRPNFSKSVSMLKTQTHKSQMTWGLVNFHQIFIFRWIIPLFRWKQAKLGRCHYQLVWHFLILKIYEYNYTRQMRIIMVCTVQNIFVLWITACHGHEAIEIQVTFRTIKTSLLTISIKSLNIVHGNINTFQVLHFLIFVYFCTINMYSCTYIPCHHFWVSKLWRKAKTAENCWHVVNKNIQFILNVWNYTVCNLRWRLFEVEYI